MNLHTVRTGHMATLRFLLPVLLFFAACSNDHRLDVTRLDTASSFRGLSVVDDDVAWASGSDGTIARTTDGGKNWDIQRIAGYEQMGFRSVYAFDAQTAVAGNAGAPAYILRTDDGGGTWSVVYVNNDTSAFLDGVDFWDDDNGMMYGDPIGGRMLLLRTSDGGRSWYDVHAAGRPQLRENEYSFAASGTGIRCYGEERVVIATGGFVSRLWVSEDKGSSWKPHETPILQGAATTGIFSFTYLNPTFIIIVGGDYLRDTLRTDHIFLSPDGGSEWRMPPEPTRGYRECVETLEGNTVVATGPTGTDISHDGGEHWRALSNERGFHTIRRARTGTLTIAVGDSGKIAFLR